MENVNRGYDLTLGFISTSQALPNFVAPPRERSLSRITSVCSSGRHLVEADRTDARSYCQTEDGRYPLPGHPLLGHLLLSVIPGLLRSFKPPTTDVALHTRRSLRGLCLVAPSTPHHSVVNVRELILKVIHQRNTSPTLHLVQRI